MGSWWSQSDQTPEPGDLIEISRGVYSHWAVYVGDGDVVHVTLPPAEVSDKVSNSLRSVPTKKAMVRKQKLQEVVGDDKWRINNILDKPRPAHIIVEEALMQVGNEMEYSAINKNCEHFATKLRYGKAVSIQGMVADVATASFRFPRRSPIEAIIQAALDLRRSQTDWQTFPSTSPPV